MGGGEGRWRTGGEVGADNKDMRKKIAIKLSKFMFYE
jgi:hypothetical protein